MSKPEISTGHHKPICTAVELASVNRLPEISAGVQIDSAAGLTTYCH